MHRPSPSEIGVRLLTPCHPIPISTRTVEFHKYQMMETLGLRTNAALIHFAIKHALVEF